MRVQEHSSSLTVLHHHGPFGLQTGEGVLAGISWVAAPVVLFSEFTLK